MAQDQDPVSEEKFETLQAEMDEQREQLLEDLAEDLGGDPDDYRVRDPAMADGSGCE